MRSTRGLLLLSSLAFTACQQHTVVEQKREANVLEGVAPAQEKPQTSRENGDAEGQKPSPYKLYPPIFTVEASSLPEPGHAFQFAYAPNSERPYQTVFVYVVAAIPNFEDAEQAPVFTSEFEAEQFMDQWATEFAQDPQNTVKLEALTKSFQWSVDAALIDDKEAVIPEVLLKGQPNYVNLTQRFKARRFTFKAPGETAVKAIINGVERSQVRFAIQAYTQAEEDAGKARYNDPTTGCVGCHGRDGAGGQGAYIKHSSDNFAFLTDEQIAGYFRDSKYPNGEDFLDGMHKWPVADAQEERALLAYLRNSTPVFDKILDLLGLSSFALGARSEIPSLRAWSPYR